VSMDPFALRRAWPTGADRVKAWQIKCDGCGLMRPPLFTRAGVLTDATLRFEAKISGWESTESGADYCPRCSARRPRGMTRG